MDKGMIIRYSWRADRSMGSEFDRVTRVSEGCGGSLTDQGRTSS